MLMIEVCGLGWIASIAILGIMHMNDSFDKIINDYSNKSFILSIMALVAGWMFWPYFLYLVYKYFSLMRKCSKKK